MSVVFDEDVTRRLRALRLAVRRALGGTATGGGATSPRAGGRFEFVGHRSYVEGDDYREIDWNLYGRLDQLFVKRFAGETDVEIRVVVDGSASMGIGEKDVAARRVAAGLAFGFVGAGRTIRVARLGDRLVDVGPLVRSEAHLAGLLNALEALGRPAGTAHLRELTSLLTPSHRPRLVFVVSDFLNEGGRVTDLPAAGSRGVDLALGCLLAREDRSPEADGPARVEGAEGDGRVRIELDETAVAHYRRRLEEVLEESEATARRRGAGFVNLIDDEPFEQGVLRLARVSGVSS